MSRYIDIEPIIKDLTAMKKVYDAIALDGMIKALREAPTADVEEVVVCRDCKHREAKWGEKQIYCYVHRKHMAIDAFCSDGERKVQE